MLAVLVAATILASEILALVNGRPITRADILAAMNNAGRQNYDEALADLVDFEHAGARDYLGRQAALRDAAQQHEPPDSIYARVLRSDYERFDANLRNRIQQQRERVYGIEKAVLDGVVEKRLFEAAARSRGMSGEALTAALAQQTGTVTKADIDFIKAYENSKAEVGATVPPGESRLEAAIRAARVERLRMAVIDSVRSKGLVGTRLSAPRVVVKTAGATLVGQASAPVHVVVFTDFECSYCHESEQTLSLIRQKYGDRVALYYFNYPLPTHPAARPAANAAMCAAAQGKYAAYHDVLFAHQSELAHPDFAGWAQAAGLDRAKFEACLAAGDTDHRIDDDIREGVAAGVDGTPTFLVNGRMVTKNDALLEVVAEEVASSR